MTIIRKLARPLLASSFVFNGLQQVRKPEGSQYLTPAVDVAAKARPELRPLRGQEKAIIQGMGVAQVAAGALFALGRFPRLSSTVLLTTSAVNTYVEFRAAEVSSKEAKQHRLATGLKNLSLVGAVAITAVDTNGNPSLAWRASKLGDDVRKKSEKLSKDVKKKSEDIFS